jgi:uncharacterized protein YbjQ (UPF0145 family)
MKNTIDHSMITSGF